jgi:hypothetical protein
MYLFEFFVLVAHLIWLNGNDYLSKNEEWLVQHASRLIGKQILPTKVGREQPIDTSADMLRNKGRRLPRPKGA